MGTGLGREASRYFQGITSFVKRTLRTSLDLIRGLGLKPIDLVKLFDKSRLPLLLPAYIIASLQGVCRYFQGITSFVKRTLRTSLDLIRGLGLKPIDLVKLFDKSRLPLLLPAYIIASLQGV
ncbi:MAG: hypothetical protein RXP86_11085, partial [Acidilobus sp.]